MVAVASGISKSTAQRLRKAIKPQSAHEVAEAAHARDYFPHHSDIAMGLHLLSGWKGLAENWPGTLLRTTSSTSKGTNGSSSSSSSSSSRHGSSSTSLQETVLPACDLAVSLLKAWPPSIGVSSSTSSSSDVPDGAIPRSLVTSLMFAISGLLLVSIRSDLLHDTGPISIPDAEFVRHLSASAAVQHLLLLQTAFSCHLLHKQRQGVSPIKAKDVVAAVSGSWSIATAAAASRSRHHQQQQLRKAAAVPVRPSTPHHSIEPAAGDSRHPGTPSRKQ
jgi:hypothetical protein